MSNGTIIREQLARGAMRARQLVDSTGLSQPTVSRAIAGLGDEVVRIGAGPSIHYALRDASRGLGDVPVYRVDAAGGLRLLGRLIPVHPDGFVMRQEDGAAQHFEGLPWWLLDMRPQGFLGRAYARRHADDLDLPANPNEWNDTQVLRALLRHGENAVGNLLLGDRARQRFLEGALPAPIPPVDRGEAYVRLAEAATRGDQPGSSAGGEQPKFAAYAMTDVGPRHVLVKFSVAEDNPIAERWQDLLLAEHVAAETLRAAGIAAVATRLFDHGGQRFLETERFDREGEMGRHALISLAALDAEFVGAGSGEWPVIVQRLAQAGHVQAQAHGEAAFLHAFGTLIGNTDMHFGNLSFHGDHGRPYTLAPAYDMLPMGFAPRSGGALPESLAEPHITPSVDNETWGRALEVARQYLERLRLVGDAFSERFMPCLAALERHVEVGGSRIARLSQGV
ncbi:type II toxin-antitoxin system HipA family toxin YjjJ [Acidihalobacter prosperus]|uniref:Phosphatidylinositol kinase n=1 Tax=Acidihalobacter prosperus TaxID=160660 RepID=A0A1A6C676_9GAMM|nr:type II toxin-antitoxin system HipA family toxin YjjJ [Acidihalobacter prosperus]OBS10066.1 phosphatidylinositol kinase [Acidihalobacter prosperus]